MFVGLTKIILFRSEHCLSLSLHFCFSSCSSRNILVLVWFSNVAAFCKSCSECGRKGSLASRGIDWHSQNFLTFPKIDAVSLWDHLCLCWLCFSAIVENQVRAAALCCQPTSCEDGQILVFMVADFEADQTSVQGKGMENLFYCATRYQPAFNCYS